MGSGNVRACWQARRGSFAAALFGFVVAMTAYGGRAHAAPIFPNMAYSVGGDPVSVASGDLDGDGRLDLVVANRWTEDLSILLGRGGGEFAAERRVSVGGIPVAVALADFNRDGRPDVVVALPVADQVAVFLTGPDGMPGRRVTLAAGDSPGAVVAADLTGDGRADIAAANHFSNDVSIFAGHGDGTFAAAASIPAGDEPISLVVGLFDAGLTPDLAVANARSCDITILLGDGAGGFRGAGPFNAGCRPPFVTTEDIVAADFDGDGATDLAAGNWLHPEEMHDIVVIPGRGDGTFAAARRVDWTVDGQLALGAADFNRDGIPDLAFGTHHGMVCCSLRGGDIILGRGDFSFEPGGTYQSGVGPVALEVADLDADGRVDLAVLSDWVWDEVTITLGRGDGTMGQTPADLDPSSWSDEIHLGDFDGDGRSDIVSADRWRGQVRVLGSDGGGRFTAPVTLPGVVLPLSVAVGDFNGDRMDDVAVLDGGAKDVAIFPAIGGGFFGGPSWISAGESPAALAAGDLTADGIDDLVVAGSDGGGQVVLLPSPAMGLPTPRFLPTGIDSPQAVGIGDVDGDGLKDIVVAGIEVALMRALAPGQFAPAALTGDFGTEYPSIAVGDFDGDGGDDVVLEMILYSWRSGPGLESTGDFPLQRAPRSLALADVDADGALDLIAIDGDFDEGDLFIVPSRDPSTRASPQRIILDGAGPGLAAGDLDGDGRVDLLIGGPGLRLLLNQGPFPNHPPHAVPQVDATVECTGPTGARVVLDGRGSTDPDSSPGTQDDIALYEWLAGPGGPDERTVASGPLADATLPLGTHAMALRVTDRAGATRSTGFMVRIVDTTPPQASAIASPARLAPPNHRIVPVHAEVAAADLCGSVSVTLEEVTSSEPDDASGIGDGATAGDISGAALGTADFDLLLRAERSGGGNGRVYELRYRIVDGSGNTTMAVARVSVPGAGRLFSGGRVHPVPRSEGIRPR
jgi:VCBS repeat protein